VSESAWAIQLALDDLASGFRRQFAQKGAPSCAHRRDL